VIRRAARRQAREDRIAKKSISALALLARTPFDRDLRLGGSFSERKVPALTEHSR